MGFSPDSKGVSTGGSWEVVCVWWGGRCRVREFADIELANL